jgi:hypothetical protein
MLRKNPRTRMSLKDVFKDAWVTNKGQGPSFMFFNISQDPEFDSIVSFLHIASKITFAKTDVSVT